MSDVDISDGEESKIIVPVHEKTKYISGPQKNYAQLSHDMYNQLKGNETESVAKIKTVKTFELTPAATEVNEVKNVSSFTLIDGTRSTVPEHLIRPPTIKVWIDKKY